MMAIDVNACIFVSNYCQAILFILPSIAVGFSQLFRIDSNPLALATFFNLYHPE
jgi:hypothetical protein